MAKGRKTKRETANMVQTALWLPRGMHEQLKQAGGDRGLGDEIRRRLRMSFDTEDTRRDQITRRLLDEIEMIALTMSMGGAWHTYRDAFTMFKAAINELVLSYQPSANAPQHAPKLLARYGPDADFEALGQMLARVSIHYRDGDASRPEHEGNDRSSGE